MARGEGKGSTKLIDAAIEILEAENPMTIRQLFYRLVSIRAIENHISEYQKVIRLMTKARKDGRAIEPIREEFGLRVDANRGFNSTSNVHDAAMRLWERRTADKDVVILYLGDWDPSGEDMERDLHDRLLEEGAGHFEIRRVAIHKADIRAYNLPPLRVKTTDTRARRFVSNHGGECVELDALSPNVLRDRLREEIESLIEPEAWERARTLEEAQRQTNKRMVGVIRQMVEARPHDQRDYDGAGL